MSRSHRRQIESCGGYFAFDLYELVWPEPPSDPEFVSMNSRQREREHGGAGKSYCATRAATAIFKTGLVLIF